MINPATNYNLNSLNRSNNTSFNSLKNIEPQQTTNKTDSELKKSNPAFKGMFGREATIVLQNLSNEARTRLGTTVSVDYMKNTGFSGKILNFLYKISYALAKHDKSGAVEFMGNGKSNIQHRRAETTVEHFVQDYLCKLMPDGKGGIYLDAGEGEILNDCVIGKGFKLYKNGNVELDQNIRNPIIDMLENCKTYKELKAKLSEIKPLS